MIKQNFSTAYKCRVLNRTYAQSNRDSLRPRRTLGFTLIEALIALAIVAIALAAIGSLAAFNIRGTARLERQLALMGTTRAVLAIAATQRASSSELPSGELDGYRWQIRSRAPRQPAAQTPWTPRLLSITVRAPDGRAFELETISLRRLTNARG